MKHEWHTDIQQQTRLSRLYNVTFSEPVEVKPDEIRKEAYFQNRMTVGRVMEDHALSIALSQDAGDSMPRVLLWKASPEAKLEVLDGHHRKYATFAINEAATIGAVIAECDPVTAERIADIVNLFPGAGVSDAYLTHVLTDMRDEGYTWADIGSMVSMPADKVRNVCVRQQQTERLRILLPTVQTPGVTALDDVAKLEDEHVKELGEPFLKATRKVRMDAVTRINESPASQRHDMAVRISGELSAAAKPKPKDRHSRSVSELAKGLTSLANRADIVETFYGAPRPKRVEMLDKINQVLPSLELIAERGQ